MVEKEKIRNELDSVKRELAQASAELFVFQRDINIRVLCDNCSVAWHVLIMVRYAKLRLHPCEINCSHNVFCGDQFYFTVSCRMHFAPAYININIPVTVPT